MKLQEIKFEELTELEMLFLKGGFNDSQRQSTKDADDEEAPPPSGN